jgi:2-polyprenyl-6-hydroxyphenyl methylase/3-demethylubiquinone-9 3-methyltransferase
VKLGAAESLPYEDGTFDLVTALDVVEHLDDDLGGLREMHRILRPAGAFCCLCRHSCGFGGAG